MQAEVKTDMDMSASGAAESRADKNPVAEKNPTADGVGGATPARGANNVVAENSAAESRADKNPVAENSAAESRADKNPVAEKNPTADGVGGATPARGANNVVAENSAAESRADKNPVAEKNPTADGVGGAAEAVENAFADCAHLVAPGAARGLLGVVAPVVADLGFELLRIRISGDEKGKVLQIMAMDEKGALSLEHCEKLSRALSAVLDVEDPIKGEYTLEVSSPGMARPLCRGKDFTAWVGHEAKLEVAQPVDGRKRFRGIVRGFDSGMALLELTLDGRDTPQVLGFPLSDIAECRLVIDETRVAAALKSAQHI